MTELSFLIDLLLNHELQKVTKDLIAMRIKDVETALNTPMYRVLPAPTQERMPPGLANQSPSTLALMAKHGDIPYSSQIPPEALIPPVPNVGQTPQAAAAMAARQAMINEAVSGKRGDVRTKKW